MRKRAITAATILALPLAFGGYSHLGQAHAQPAVKAAALLADHDSDDRRGDARDMGHRDGMRAAYDDVRDRRHADADDHQMYKHPPVNKHQQKDYRAGFRDGYQEGVRNAQSEGFRDYDNNDRQNQDYYNNDRQDRQDYNDNNNRQNRHDDDDDRR